MTEIHFEDYTGRDQVRTPLALLLNKAWSSDSSGLPRNGRLRHLRHHPTVRGRLNASTKYD